MSKPAWALAALLVLSACSQAPKADPNDLNASLAPEILKWTEAVEAAHPICKTKIEGKGCEGFDIACKGALDVTPAEKARGVTAKVVAAVIFTARTSDGSTGKPGSAFAEFTQAGGAWTRAEALPVNPSTCAKL